MTIIEAYRLADGRVVEGYAQAKRLTEAAYANELSKLAAQLTALELKYTKVGDFIDANLPAFIHLSALKADCTIENPAS